MSIAAADAAEIDKRYADGAAYIDAAYVPIAEARIPVLDWGVTRSDITYDVVPARDGGFFRLGHYLDRFEASMASLDRSSALWSCRSTAVRAARRGASSPRSSVPGRRSTMSSTSVGK